MTSYPQIIKELGCARVASVGANSPAAKAGLVAGTVVLGVNGTSLKDILDWYWHADEYEIELEVLIPSDQDNDTSDNQYNNVSNKPANNEIITKPFSLEDATASPQLIVLSREPGESWGIEFSEVIFDGLRSCVNNCSFCFMKMLPEGMREALYVRDDDYRLSFLHGNFVTLTNLSEEDTERITSMHLSPLNVSLHAVDSAVRERMMGRNHARGIEVLEQLLAAGIEFKAQVVLMPGVNDGMVLDETLEWAARRPGITALGIVPYGYTQYAKIQEGFDTPESARVVIEQVEAFNKSQAAINLQAQLADEFFLKAWPGEILTHLPSADYYGDYAMLEDGIGMLRQFIDEAPEWGVSDKKESAFSLITGEAFASVLQELFPHNKDRIIAIKNEFFGGNVDVAGLLTARDIINQVPLNGAQGYCAPPTMFNDDGLTLDNKTATYIASALNAELKVLDF